jgi:23S rRNA (cytosine1962-C5)-methyltransferase
MRVLNTFAQGGGFSIAAAAAGAETVSLDLSKDWLARIPLQLADHGVDLERHDQIYGDVFNWIPRLARRGEQYDLVILDPPSTSIGTKKRRWSARRDYPELVSMASALVAPGGRLWTATNHRGLPPNRFARLVARGLPEGYSLERVCPLAEDFPCVDVPHLKTLVWRSPG